MNATIPLEEKKLPQNCYVFKNSTTCPVSAAAAAQVKQIEFDRDLYWVNVIEQRELSNWIEETYSTRHESPQLLRIIDGVVSDVWNHNQIKKENVSS